MTNTIQKASGRNANDLGNVVDTIFNNTLSRFFDGNFWNTGEITGREAVPVNVRETDVQYEVDVIAPGCKKENFKVQVQNNELKVSFTQNESKKHTDEKAGWVRNEYIQRSFSRQFTLDETVDTTKIDAQYVDGILRVILPKNEQAKQPLLTINVK
ncbi:MAG: Hsp20/alpha crystallin family protein [Bacteroidetes bacterium]|nr:MAG: Hsp20/alpha crystallin family protein [Bacteroidota bacterium]